MTGYAHLMRRAQGATLHLTVGLAVMTTACVGPNSQSVKRNRSLTGETAEHPQWNHVRSRLKYSKAEQQCEAGLFDEAIRTISESIALDPTDPDAYGLLARAQMELGKPASAQQALEAAKLAGLSSSDLTYMQGVILEQSGQLEAAVAEYAKARAGARLAAGTRLESRTSRNVDYLIAEAECLVALDRPVEALELLDGSVRQVNDEGTIWALAGHVAALLGDHEGAVKRYREALVDAAPPHSASEGGPAGARLAADARFQSRTSPGTTMVAQELGLLLVKSERYDEALPILASLLDKAVGGRAAGARAAGARFQSRTSPVTGAVRRGLATCYLALNDPASAKQVLAEYGPAHPRDTLAQLLLAKAAIATDDLLTALRAVALAEQGKPDHLEVKLVRAVLQWKRGDLAAAATSLSDLLAKTPDDLEARCLLAEVLLAQHKPDKARVHFERALKIDPGCPWATAGLNWTAD